MPGTEENISEEQPELPYEKSISVPNVMPSNVVKAISKYGDALDAIGNEFSNQNVILTKSLSKLRTIEQGLGDVEFLLGQIGENYQEALDDFETRERIKQFRQKIFTGITSPFKNKTEDTKISKQEPPEKSNGEPWWNALNPFKNSQQKLASGGISSLGTGTNKIIPPGIYDNPTQGNLAPGTAVVPLNRNYGKKILNQYEQQQYSQLLGDVLSVPTKGLLGSAVSVLGVALKSLGPLSGYFNQNIPELISGVSSILGISRNAVINMFGGPAYAGIDPNDLDRRYFYRSWRIYMDKNGLYFPGAPGIFGGPEEDAEFAKDILVIGPNGEGLGGKGGTNVGKPPAWIPFSKDAAGKLEYSSGFGLRWGKQHTGIDLAGEPGIKIITPFAGEVYEVNRGAVEGDRRAGGGYGNFVGIAHESPKIFTFYGHLKDVADSIEVGKKVKAGQVIGTLGNTGFSTGPHLHWEVRTEAGGGQIDPVEWTHQNKPSFSGGGWLGVVSSLASKIVKKPQGLSIKGVQAGFTGMAKQGFEAIMGGDKFRLGSWKPQILGRGAYSAPTAKGAQKYAGSQGSLGGKQTPGGVVKSIVPGGARRINFLEPQAAVKPATFDKGKLLADKLLGGTYSNSPLANKLRNQLLSGSASVGSDLLKIGKLGGKLLGAAGPILDLAFPDPVGSFDQISGPNAYYNAPEYKKPKPVRTIEMSAPSTPSVSPSFTQNNIQFLQIDIPTDVIMTTTQMRRI